MRSSLVLIALLGLVGCRGMQSDAPPVHPNLNMDFDQSFKPQSANPLFADGMAMRQPVPGTVKRMGLRTTENASFYLGRDAAGAYVPTAPMEVTVEVLERGQERYEIYCAVCHGSTGDGQGVIMAGNGGQGYGYTPAPTYHTDRLRAIEDGYLYDVIANGIRTMPSYGHQVPVPDRWAIVAYIRALQLSQDANPETLPEPMRERLESYNPNVTLPQ